MAGAMTEWKRRILIVDDESDICLMLANVVEDKFHTFDYPFLALDNFRNCIDSDSHALRCISKI